MRALKSPYYENLDQGLHVYQILKSEDEPTTARWEGRPVGHSQTAYDALVRGLIRHGGAEVLVSWNVMVPLLSKRVLSYDLETRKRYSLSRAADVVRSHLMRAYLPLRNEVIYTPQVLSEYPSMGIPPLDHDETQTRLGVEIRNANPRTFPLMNESGIRLLSLCTVITADSRDALRMSLAYGAPTVDTLPHTITRIYKMVALLNLVTQGGDAGGRWKPLQPSYVSVRRPKHLEAL